MKNQKAKRKLDMLELPNVKAVKFYGRTQFSAYSDFMVWFGDHKDIVILALADEGPDLDEKETPFNVTIFYEAL